MSEMDKFLSNFKQIFINTMREPEAQDALREVMKPLSEANTENIAKLTDIVEVQKNEIKTLKMEIEELRIREKQKSLIISGMKKDDTKSVTDQVISLCKDNMQVNLHPDDIDDIFRGKTNTKTKDTPIIIKLTTQRKKVEIMKSKKALKNLPDSKIFINECLTTTRANCSPKPGKWLKRRHSLPPGPEMALYMSKRLKLQHLDLCTPRRNC